MTDTYGTDPKRIVVVGTTGSGKTTLARQVAARLGYPHLEMDAFHWGANWTERPTDLMRQRVGEAILADQWVLDGNYSKVRDLVWRRADTIIWLDYRLSLTLWRLFRRTAYRMISREALWSGNRESWRMAFSRDSILLWALRTYHRRKREFPLLFQQPEYAHLRVLHFTSPRETERWLQQPTLRWDK